MTRSHWSNRWAFIMAAAGSAVGLGNIWKFPYMTGTNGGSAFVLVYLACVALIGLPLMMTEIMLGRRAQKNPVDGMAQLAAEAGASQLWKGVGYLGIAAGVLILAFYSVVAGWVLDYIVRAASGASPASVPVRRRRCFAASSAMRASSCCGTRCSCSSPCTWWRTASPRGWSAPTRS